MRTGLSAKQCAAAADCAPIDADDIAVTAGLLAAVMVLLQARELYRAESDMARTFGLGDPGCWRSRCRARFYGELAPRLQSVGLAVDDVTLDVLLAMPIPVQACATDWEALPTRFAFNVWAGGIRALAAQPARPHAVSTERIRLVSRG